MHLQKDLKLLQNGVSFDSTVSHAHAQIDWCFPPWAARLTALLGPCRHQVPAEMTQRPVCLDHEATRVLGPSDGFGLTLVNYTLHSSGYHFDIMFSNSSQSGPIAEVPCP